MKARAVVRDVGRVMEFPISEVDRVAKLIPATLDMTLDKAIEEAPALAELERKDERVRDLLKVARRLEGMTRHASIHAAGVVIAPRPLVEFVPLYKSQKDENEITTQWSMKEIERVGLLKMDFLGLSTLTLLDDAVKHIKETLGVDVDLEQLPRRRKDVSALRRRQDAGVFVRKFGIATRCGKRSRLARRFDRVERATAVTARRGRRRLHQPAARPRRGNAAAADGSGAQGKHGIIVQEQTRTASELAGFTLASRSVPRRWAKDARVMQAQRERRHGREARGTPEKKASKVFGSWSSPGTASTSRTGGPRAAAYQTGYSRRTSRSISWRRCSRSVAELTRSRCISPSADLGVPMLPPDINRASCRYGPGWRRAVRSGAVKNVGEGAILSMSAAGKTSARSRRCSRSSGTSIRLVNKKVFESREGRRVRHARAADVEGPLPGARASSRTRPARRSRRPVPARSRPGSDRALRRRFRAPSADRTRLAECRGRHRRADPKEALGLLAAPSRDTRARSPPSAPSASAS